MSARAARNFVTPALPKDHVPPSTTGAAQLTNESAALRVRDPRPDFAPADGGVRDEAALMM